MFRPDAKYLSAVRKIKGGKAEESECDCELSKLLYAVKLGRPQVVCPLSRALGIYKGSQQSRYIIEAMLISSDGTTEIIAELMDSDPKMIDMYRKYFFDTSVFLDKFDLADYISMEKPESRVTKTMAVTQGVHFVASHLNGGGLAFSTKEMYDRIQAGAYRMFQQGATAAITSDAAKESKAWAGILKDITALIDKKSDDGGHQDFISEFRVLFKHEGSAPNIATLNGEVVRG